MDVLIELVGSFVLIVIFVPLLVYLLNKARQWSLNKDLEVRERRLEQREARMREKEKMAGCTAEQWLEHQYEEMYQCVIKERARLYNTVPSDN